MTRHPVIFPTSLGTLAGVVHEPDRDPLGSIVLLHGGTGRSGPNRVWARLADSLCAQGLLVFRTDDRDVEDVAQGNDERAKSAAAAVSIDWFRSQTAGLDLLVCGRCMGARTCLVYTVDHPEVAGLGLIAPRFYHYTKRADWSLSRGGLVTTLKRGAQRAARFLPSLTDRVARTVVESFDQGQFDSELRPVIDRLDGRRPLWILLGGRDRQWRRLWSTETRPPELASAEIEVVPDVVVHANRTIRSQEAVIDRVTAWALRTLATRTGA